MSAVVCLLMTSLAMIDGDVKNYARPDMLIEAKDLARPEMAKKFRILDARGQKWNGEARIPSSVPVDVYAWSEQFAAGPNTAFFEENFARLGLMVDTPVVVVGDSMPETARVWWILRYWGPKDARILNGGWAAWTQGKFPVKEGGDRAGEPAGAVKVKLIPAEQRLATKEQIKSSLKDQSLQIVDARAQAEFCGDMKLAKRGGAIPGAINLDWKALMEPKSQRFKSAAELDKLFKKAGIDLTKPLAAHCQSGGRSSVMVFALELMGASEPRNYYRSWAEWGNADDTPVIVPKKEVPGK